MPLARLIFVLLVCALAFGASGCRKRRAQAAPPPVPTVERKPLPEEVPPPEISVPTELPPPPELVVPPPRPASRPPRRSTPAPAPAPQPAVESETPETKPATPRMAPRLSPAEQAQFQERTWQAIALAEKNLQAVNGKRLTSAQQDLEGKVRGFLAQAREAIGVADWARALNLAEKAHVLSRELLASLGL